jgi:hypothetical protein
MCMAPSARWSVTVRCTCSLAHRVSPAATRQRSAMPGTHAAPSMPAIGLAQFGAGTHDGSSRVGCGGRIARPLPVTPSIAVRGTAQPAACQGGGRMLTVLQPFRKNTTRAAGSPDRATKGLRFIASTADCGGLRSDGDGVARHGLTRGPGVCEAGWLALSARGSISRRARRCRPEYA